MTDAHCGAKCMLKSTLPLATASFISAFDGALMYWISVNPSARSSSSAAYSGAMQMLWSFGSLTVVVSSPPAAASTGGAPVVQTTAPAAENAFKSRRRVNVIGILKPPSSSAHAFSSRLSSFRKRQSVPSAMIFCGLTLIMPASRMRSA